MSDYTKKVIVDSMTIEEILQLLTVDAKFLQHKIYDFLQSPEINKRSSLRDKDIDIKQDGVLSYRSINHDILYTWKNTVLNYKLNYLNGISFT